MVEKLDLNTPEYAQLEERIQQNQLLVQELNTQVHDAVAVREPVSQITGRPVDESTEIRLPFYTDCGVRIHLGKRVFINSNCMFTDLGTITLEDDALIGPNVTLATVNHRRNPAERRHLDLAPIVIKRRAWVGANATITPGVTIGENAIVAAGAVVTKDVAANTIIGGIPARVIGRI